MIKNILTSLRAILVLTVLTSVAYPLLVTGIAQALFPSQSQGSLIRRGETIVGSELLAQKFTGAGYFWTRPSAADFATLPSGASNQGFTSKKMQSALAERRAAFGADAPPDLLTASGSGLDPDLSVEAARFQASRVAADRGVALEKVQSLVNDCTTPPQWGFLGQARVNVLALNLKLDATKE